MSEVTYISPQNVEHDIIDHVTPMEPADTSRTTRLEAVVESVAFFSQPGVVVTLEAVVSRLMRAYGGRVLGVRHPLHAGNAIVEAKDEGLVIHNQSRNGSTPTVALTPAGLELAVERGWASDARTEDENDIEASAERDYEQAAPIESDVLDQNAHPTCRALRADRSLDSLDSLDKLASREATGKNRRMVLKCIEQLRRRVVCQDEGDVEAAVRERFGSVFESGSPITLDEAIRNDMTKEHQFTNRGMEVPNWRDIPVGTFAVTPGQRRVRFVVDMFAGLGSRVAVLQYVSGEWRAGTQKADAPALPALMYVTGKPTGCETPNGNIRGGACDLLVDSDGAPANNYGRAGFLALLTDEQRTAFGFPVEARVRIEADESVDMLEAFPLCAHCVDSIGGASAGPDAPWRPAAEGEACGAADCVRTLLVDASDALEDAAEMLEDAPEPVVEHVDSNGIEQRVTRIERQLLSAVTLGEHLANGGGELERRVCLLVGDVEGHRDCIDKLEQQRREATKDYTHLLHKIAGLDRRVSQQAHQIEALQSFLADFGQAFQHRLGAAVTPNLDQ